MDRSRPTADLRVRRKQCQPLAPLGDLAGKRPCQWARSRQSRWKDDIRPRPRVLIADAKFSVRQLAPGVPAAPIWHRNCGVSRRSIGCSAGSDDQSWIERHPGCYRPGALRAPSPSRLRPVGWAIIGWRSSRRCRDRRRVRRWPLSGGRTRVGDGALHLLQRLNTVQHGVPDDEGWRPGYPDRAS